METIEKGSHESDAEERIKAKLAAVQAAAESQVSELDLSSPSSAQGTARRSVPGVEGGALATGAVEAGHRGEVSASTIARMMGVATANELSMLESKIDLLASRVNNIVAKFERVQTALTKLPTSSDFDRIDINIGSLKTLIKEALDKVSVQSSDQALGDQGTLQKAKIMSSGEE